MDHEVGLYFDSAAVCVELDYAGFCYIYAYCILLDCLLSRQHMLAANLVIQKNCPAKNLSQKGEKKVQLRTLITFCVGKALIPGISLPVSTSLLLTYMYLYLLNKLVFEALVKHKKSALHTQKT
jgi:hypothetical protein